MNKTKMSDDFSVKIFDQMKTEVTFHWFEFIISELSSIDWEPEIMKNQMFKESGTSPWWWKNMIQFWSIQYRGSSIRTVRFVSCVESIALKKNAFFAFLILFCRLFVVVFCFFLFVSNFVSFRRSSAGPAPCEMDFRQWSTRNPKKKNFF